MFSRLKSVGYRRYYLNQCEKALMISHRAGGSSSGSGGGQIESSTMIAVNEMNNVTALQPLITKTLTPKNDFGVEKSRVISPNVFDGPNGLPKSTNVSCFFSFKRQMYHVTVLSNFARGYKKYSNRFEKVPESKFQDKFHLLHQQELNIGYKKSHSLFKKLEKSDDTSLVIQTMVGGDKDLIPTEDTGLGQYVLDNGIAIEKLFVEEPAGSKTLIPISIEDAYARSLKSLEADIVSWEDVVPRTVSILPMAKGCQAKCPFCFSHASVSEDTKQKRLDIRAINGVLDLAADRGATRAVITGGGEPLMVPRKKIIQIIQNCSDRFDKVVLITNGYAIGRLDPARRLEALSELQNAGLNILCISRHGVDSASNRKVMHLDTKSEEVAETYRLNKAMFLSLDLRWVCVLQKGAVDSSDKIGRYLDWVTTTGVTQVCFKELYVSSSHESVYHDHKSNLWSREHQIPLHILVDFLQCHRAEKVAELPWGSPIYRLVWNGQELQIAAYTEPSVYWERLNGQCRSWNLMADGLLYASLEDRSSALQYVPAAGPA